MKEIIEEKWLEELYRVTKPKSKIKGVSSVITIMNEGEPEHHEVKWRIGAKEGLIKAINKGKTGLDNHSRYNERDDDGRDGITGEDVDETHVVVMEKNHGAKEHRDNLIKSMSKIRENTDVESRAHAILPAIQRPTDFTG